MDLRNSIVIELEEIGYNRSHDRVQMLVNIDVAGAEQMAVDLPPAEWRSTLNANLVSNYSLIEKVVPMMKARGSGYILNVSSHLGGEKYIAVTYPNRSDYAVSKAGQRLKGKDGIFNRRARLILENKRLNRVHGAVLEALESGVLLGDILMALAHNDLGLLQSDGVPEPLRQIAATIKSEARGTIAASRSLFEPSAMEE